MLPTLGLFRILPCPFYVVGLCERPNCSFRHCRSDVEAARRASSKAEADEPKEDSDTETAAGSENSTPPLPTYSKGAIDIQNGQNKISGEIPRSGITSITTRMSGDETSPKLTLSTVLGLKPGVKRDIETPLEPVSPPKRLRLEEKSVDKLGDISKSGDVFIDSGKKEVKTDDKAKKKEHSRKSRERSLSSSSSSKSHKDNHKSHKSSHKDKNSKTSRHSSSSTKHDSHSKSSRSSKSKDHSHPKSHEGKHSSKSSSPSKSKKEPDRKSSDEKAEGSMSVQPLHFYSNIADEVKKTEDAPAFRDDITDVPDDFLYPSDEEDDPDQIALECFKMFQDYKSDDKSVETINLETLPEPKIQIVPENENESAVGKKRVAHAGAVKSVFDKPPPLKRKETIQEQLLRRFQTIQEASNNTATNVSCNKPVPSTSAPLPVPMSLPQPLGPIASSKRRIAHVSNATALSKPPPRPGDSSNSTVKTPPNGSNKPVATLSQTVSKGERRVAHTPSMTVNSSSAPAPKIIPDGKGKVPPLVRQKFLDQIYRECLQLYGDSSAASNRALEEEKSLVAKCNTKQVYTCSAINLITRIRKEYRDCNSSSDSGSSSATRTMSHSEILAGKSSGNVSWSIEKKQVFNPTGTLLYSKLQEYLMSSTELIDNGYPRKCPLTYKGCSGLAVIKEREDSAYSRVIEDSLRKTCDRCKTSYLVGEDGFPKVMESCTYHTGRRFGKRTRTGNAETRYNCCDGEVSSAGCCTGACHVSTGKTQEELKNFICAALEAGDPAKMGTQTWDVIGVDCEMVYTTRGSQLARATFVGADGKVIYDTLVKPTHPVLDYNTRYSGIEESMLLNTTTTIKEVHLKILANLKPNSIIVGHSLENDLIALKLIHGCVVDTSLVFPHKMGPPYKRALRNLSADFLGKIIQVGDNGHDSAEDARAALDLMIWKVKNDHQKAPRRIARTE